MAYNDLNEEEQFIFDWQYRMHGNFYTNLMQAMCRADLHNLARLAKGFPMEVSAYKKYSNVPLWWEGVIKKYESI